MYTLLLDIGNSSVKAAVGEGDRLLSVARADRCTESFLQSLTACYRPAAAIVSSVRGDGAAVAARLQAHVSKVIVLSHTTPIPIRNLYDTPDSLGVDRLAAAVGAAALFPQRTCLIIDCGTAITIDFLDASGAFIGGNISPGLTMRFRALHTFTAGLPMVAAGEMVAAIGASTREAIESGVVRGTLHELEGYLAQYPAGTPVFTGGDAFYLAKRIKKPIFVACNLNFIGLAKILHYNVSL
ncbi:MAG: type III pantothenate kinase [Prevotellaceae bacterium]|jgi:type III pantothenate kinase|nr:type III pantothenate kinase [Prevotellaceae bacterium]